MYFALFVDTDLTELNVKLNEGFTIQNEYVIGGRHMFVLRNRDLERNTNRIGTALGQQITAVQIEPEVDLGWTYTTGTGIARG